MKDATVNLLVFLLVFALFAILFLASYGLSLILIPGGRGLVFANPYAAALLPSLLGALAVAQVRSIRYPGNFALTWGFQLLAFFLLLTLPLPWISHMQPVRAADASPLTDSRFVLLGDGSRLVADGPSTVLVPSNGEPMTVSQETQYDSLNQRFVFSSGEPQSISSFGPERNYYQFTRSLEAFEMDLLAVYTKLNTNLQSNPLVFWATSAAISWLFMGGYLLFSLRTWSLVRVVALLVLIRLELILLVYSLWSLPALLALWLPQWALLATWSPVLLIGVAASCFFFMTLLAKPHRRESLE